MSPLRLPVIFVLFLPLAGAADSFRDRIKDHLYGSLNNIISTQSDCGLDFENGRYICNKFDPGRKHLNGGWQSHIIPIMKPFKARFLDSNMFVTSHVLYPLWFLDSNEIPGLRRARRMAIRNINLYRRGNGYSFWVELDPSLGSINRIGPLNLSTLLISSELSVVNGFKKATRLSLLPRDIKWALSAFDKSNKLLRGDVLFSPPNDADDTSLAIISNYYDIQEKIGNSAQPDEKLLAALREYISYGSVISRYTDDFEPRLGRMILPETKCTDPLKRSSRRELFSMRGFVDACSLDDPREKWRYDAYKNTHSGAYMTWLYDENSAIYANPENGVVLTGQNSVDCVVVANALYSISLTGLKNNPAYRDAYTKSCNAMTNVVLDGNDELRLGYSGQKHSRRRKQPVWKYCGLFYPALLLFPYALSRAVRDAGACKDLGSADQARFNRAQARLVSELSREQDMIDTKTRKKRGQWYERLDKSPHLATSLGTAALLNFGPGVAAQSGMDLAGYKEHIRNGLAWIMQLRKRDYSTPEGSFFGGGMLNEKAIWKSAPFATAISLEAMTKYLLGYSDSDAGGRRKLELSEIRRHSALATFKESMVETNNEEFLDKHLSGFTGDKSKLDKTFAEASQIYGTRTNRDRAGKTTRSTISVKFETGYMLRELGHYGIVAVDLTMGRNYRDGNDMAAYYAVKLGGEIDFNFNDSSEQSYRVSARFLGVATRTDTLSTEVGMLPVAFVSEKDVSNLEAHLLYMAGELPVADLGKGVSLNIYAVGKLIGYLYKTSQRIDDLYGRHTISFADLDIGVSLKHSRIFSLSVSAGTNLGFSIDKTGHGYKMKFALPYRVGAGLTFRLIKTLFLSLRYAHEFDSALYPDRDVFYVTVGGEF